MIKIEAVLMPGKGKLILTGQLGDVMKESAQAALSYARAHANEFNIDHKIFTVTICIFTCLQAQFQKMVLQLVLQC